MVASCHMTFLFLGLCTTLLHGMFVQYVQHSYASLLVGVFVVVPLSILQRYLDTLWASSVQRTPYSALRHYHSMALSQRLQVWWFGGGWTRYDLGFGSW
jgi:hypothetical protein